MTPTSEVSFISAMKSLSSGGIDPSDRLGHDHVAHERPWLIPSERAASICPRGTPSMPAR